MRIFDMAYTPRDDDKNLTRRQMWTYRGESYVSAFVVKID